MLDSKQRLIDFYNEQERELSQDDWLTWADETDRFIGKVLVLILAIVLGSLGLGLI